MTEATFGVRIVDRTRAGAISAGRSFDDLRKKAGDTNKAVGSIEASFGKLGTYLAGYIGFRAVTGLMRSATDAALQFGASMAEVSTLLKDTSGMAGLTSSVRALTREFGGDHVTEAKALYQIISSGATDAAKAMDLLRVSNQLAVGGVTDVATAASGLVTILNAWKNEAGSSTQVSDMLFTAMRMGTTTIGELSRGIGYVASIAAQTGVGLDEILAAVVSLTLQGLPTERAMRGLAQVIASTIKPSGEAANEAARLGLSFSAQALRARGLVGMLAEVQEKTKGSAASQALLYGGIEALGPIMALTGKGAEDFTAALQAMGESAGETGTAVAKMMDDPLQKMKQLQANWADLQVSMGEAMLRVAEGPVASLSDSLSTLNDRLAAGIPLWRIMLANAEAMMIPGGATSSEILAGWSAQNLGKAAPKSPVFASQNLGRARGSMLMDFSGPLESGGGIEKGLSPATLLALVREETRPAAAIAAAGTQGPARPTEEFRFWEMFDRLDAEIAEFGTTAEDFMAAEREGWMLHTQSLEDLAAPVAEKIKAERNEVADLSTARELEADALREAQARHYAYERVLRSGLSVLSALAPESQRFFDAAASFFSGDLLGGALNVIGGIVQQTGLLTDTSAKLRQEIAKTDALRSQIAISAGDQASRLAEMLDPAGYAATMGSVLEPLEQTFEKFKIGRETWSTFEQIEGFLTAIGRVTKSFASGSFMQGDGGVSTYQGLFSTLQEMFTVSNTGDPLQDILQTQDAFDQWQTSLESIFGGGGTLTEAVVKMFELQTSIEGVGVAAKSVATELTSAGRAVDLRFAAEEIRIRSQFARQFQQAGGDVFEQRRLNEAMQLMIGSLQSQERLARSRMGAGGVSAVLADSGVAGKVAVGGATGGTGGGAGVEELFGMMAGDMTGALEMALTHFRQVLPGLAINDLRPDELITFPTADDFSTWFMGEGSIATSMTMALQITLDHWRGVLPGIAIDDLRPDELIVFPTADQFSTWFMGEGSVAASMTAALQTALGHWRGVLPGLAIDDLRPDELVSFPTSDDFATWFMGEGSVAANMTAALQMSLEHWRMVLPGLAINDLRPDELITFPTSEDLSTHFMGGGSVAASMSAALEIALTHFRGVMPGLAIDDLRPNELLTFPTAEAWDEYHGLNAANMTAALEASQTHYREVLPTQAIDDLWAHDFIVFPEASQFADQTMGKNGLASRMTDALIEAIYHYWGVLVDWQMHPWAHDFIEFPAASQFSDQTMGGDGLATRMTSALVAALAHFQGVLTDRRLSPWAHEFLAIPPASQFTDMTMGGDGLANRMTGAVELARNYFQGVLPVLRTTIRASDLLSLPSQEEISRHVGDQGASVAAAIRTAMSGILGAVGSVNLRLVDHISIDTSGFEQLVANAVNEAVKGRKIVALPGGGSYTPY